jgi:hypothetical protein
MVFSKELRRLKKMIRLFVDRQFIDSQFIDSQFIDRQVIDPQFIDYSSNLTNILTSPKNNLTY